MEANAVRRLSFIAEWYQEEAGIVRTFYISFFIADNAIEVFEPRTKKVFLRRTKMKDLQAKDLFVGSKIDIFGRQFDIIDYGDEITRNNLAKYRKRTFVLFKDNIIGRIGMILDVLIQSQFSINKGQMVQFTNEVARDFLGEQKKGDVELAVVMNHLIAGPSMGFELIADNAVKKLWYCKHQDKESFQEGMPQQLRALFEDEELRNGTYCSVTDEDATAAIAFFFNSKTGPALTPVLNNTTLAFLKPHAIKEGKMGKIISEITNNGFKITALRMKLLERIHCEEVYEVYRGVLSEYIQLVSQLASGPCMALEVKCTDESKESYTAFRNFCGPQDPEIARLLRPHTLRAKFGVNKVLNAIHCTDLKEDCVLEIQYFFQILE